MMMTVTMPESPPELTDSRSSKSSSYCSRFSTENDFSVEVTNFEDIGLGEDVDTEDIWHEKSGRRQARGSSRRERYFSRQSTISPTSYRSKTKIEDDRSTITVTEVTTRESTTSPPIIVAISDSKPRSSSPPKRIPRSVSTSSATIHESALSPAPCSPLPQSRRSSWQPQRKTIKEIEAEYHDSDDELPDDAHLWNVPVSPFHSANASPRSSFRGSPERRISATTTPQPIPLEHVKSAPVRQNPFRNVSNVPMRHKLTARSVSANTVQSNPTSPILPNFIRTTRAKSWNVVVAELDMEARIVSQNLESHAETLRAMGQNSGSVMNNAHRSSVPNTIQLPPIQRGPLDFMPTSKEKEAVLSRTRPSWLPPKDPKEEQKHLREYQRMMAASLQAEKKKETKSKLINCQKDSTRNSLNRIWDFYIDPTTDINIIDKRVHDLCWYGVPARARGKVWQRTVGNPLGLTDNIYTKAHEKAIGILSKKATELTDLEKKISNWLSDIDRDAETAFPELGLFQRNGPLWKQLVSLCEAYACYRSDIGYQYGIQLIAGLILLQIPDLCEAFIFMANCLNKPVPQAFHTSDIVSTQRTYKRVLSKLQTKFPGLHDYLFNSTEAGGLGMTSAEVLEPMFRTLFSNGLDLDHACRIWDIWIFQGDQTLIRTAVAILGSLESQIFDVKGDLSLKRRNVQEMLGWGPFNRTKIGTYWNLESLGGLESFIDEVEAAGKLDYTGR